MIEGRIDTTNFNQFEIEINLLFNSGEKISSLIAGLNYISSSGLRVFLIAQKNQSPLMVNSILYNLQQY